MITNVTKSTQFGVNATHHKIMEYTYDKASGKVKMRIYSYPSLAVANSNNTPLLITDISMRLADLTVMTSAQSSVNIRKYLNDARDLLEQEVVKLPDWAGGVVS